MLYFSQKFPVAHMHHNFNTTQIFLQLEMNVNLFFKQKVRLDIFIVSIKHSIYNIQNSLAYLCMVILELEVKKCELVLTFTSMRLLSGWKCDIEDCWIDTVLFIPSQISLVLVDCLHFLFCYRSILEYSN